MYSFHFVVECYNYFLVTIFFAMISVGEECSAGEAWWCNSPEGVRGHWENM